MGELAIRTERLAKRYRIGVGQASYRTLRESLVDLVAAPINRLRRSLTRSGETGQIGDEAPSQIWALRDVSLEIKTGEVVGVVGRNGAGKSTLLKILSRITRPTRGRAEVVGRVGSLLEVGIGFHPELSGRENIYLYGAILGMKKAEIGRKFDEIVAFAELEKFLDTPAKHYSSGMYVRLAFAVAAHLEPEVLLVDEVLAVGDYEFQRKCLGRMRQIGGEGRTVVFVSHNLAALQNLCPRAILIRSGEVAADGPAHVTIQRYLAGDPGRSEAANAIFEVDRRVLDAHRHDDLAITGITLQTPEGAPLLAFGTGDPLTVRICYETRRHFVAPAFGVSVRNYLGAEVLRLSTMPMGGYEIRELYPRGYADLTIPSFPFAAGRYYLDIGFGRAQVEWVLKYEYVVTLNVEPRDIYHSGDAVDQTRSLLVVPHYWKHMPAQARQPLESSHRLGNSAGAP